MALWLHPMVGRGDARRTPLEGHHDSLRKILEARIDQLPDLYRTVFVTLEDAFSFDRKRCDRVVARVLARARRS